MEVGDRIQINGDKNKPIETLTKIEGHYGLFESTIGKFVYNLHKIQDKEKLPKEPQLKLFA